MSHNLSELSSQQSSSKWGAAISFGRKKKQKTKNKTKNQKTRVRAHAQ